MPQHEFEDTPQNKLRRMLTTLTTLSTINIEKNGPLVINLNYLIILKYLRMHQTNHDFCRINTVSFFP